MVDRNGRNPLCSSGSSPFLSQYSLSLLAITLRSPLPGGDTREMGSNGSEKHGTGRVWICGKRLYDGLPSRSRPPREFPSHCYPCKSLENLGILSRTYLHDAQPFGVTQHTTKLDAVTGDAKGNSFVVQSGAGAGPRGGKTSIDVDVHSPCPLVPLVHSCRPTLHRR